MTLRRLTDARSQRKKQGVTAKQQPKGVELKGLNPHCGGAHVRTHTHTQSATLLYVKDVL